MRLLVVTNLYPNPAEPNRGIFTHQITRQLSKTYSLDVVTPIPWFPRVKLGRSLTDWAQLAQIPHSYEVEGIRVFAVRYPYLPKLGSLVHPWLMFPTLYCHLRASFQRERYDGILASWIFPDGVATAMAAHGLNVPVVLNGVGCDINLYAQSRIRRPQIQMALRISDSVITVSRDLEQRVIDLGMAQNRVFNIPNGVDLDSFQPRDKFAARKELSLEMTHRMILFVGSLEEVKGIQYLLDAVLYLRERADREFFLVMIGDGSWRGLIKDFISRRALTGIVKMAGTVSHDRIPLYMNAADILCLPSIREGHPNVVNEALASGIPVVGSRVGAIPQLVHPDCGIIVEPRDSLSLAKGLQLALDIPWDPSLIRARVQGQSWAACARRYADVIAAVVKGRKSTRCYR